MSLVCPTCHTANRANARFCAGCGVLLPLAPAAPYPAPARVQTASAAGATAPIAPTLKICPRCQSQNGLGASACRQCGHRFTTPVSSKRYWRTRLAVLVGIAAAVLLLVAGASSLWARFAAPAPLDPEAALQRAIQATVQVMVPEDSQPGGYSAGSGTVLNQDGYILTNLHVIADPDTGQLYNQLGVVYIGVTPAGSSKPPVLRYQAEVVDTDPVLDLALLRVVALENGSGVPRNLGLTAVPIGDSDKVQIGDAVTVLGYPGLGGDTITLTRGTVSGFLDNWIKTDAETNHGNSGGAAINAAGELIGVPTAGNSEDPGVERLPGKIGLIRPINLAHNLLEQAQP